MTSSDPKSKCGMEADDEDDEEEYEYEEIEVEEDDDDEVEYEEIEVEEEVEDEEEVEVEEEEEEEEEVEYEEVEEEVEEEVDDDDEEEEEDDEEEEIADEPVIKANSNGVIGSVNWIDQSSKGNWKSKKKPKKNPLAPKGVLNNFKGKKKKVDQSDAECFFCKKKGHWKRNCKEYLASLKDKKQGNTYMKSVFMAAIDSNKRVLDPLTPKGVLINSKGKKKKVDQSDAECFFCKKKGHWKRNCKEYLATLKDKK